MKKLPKKFVMTTKYARAAKYTMEQCEHGMYHLTEEDGKPVKGLTAKHSEAFVKACLDEGSWILEKDLDERELVFPAYAKHSSPEYQDDTCPEANIKIEKSDIEGYVKVTWGDGSVNDDFWSVDSYKRLIKEGIWIVKHVGEEVEEKSPTYAPNSAYADKGDAVTRVEAPPATGAGSLKIDVECNTDAAVANIERLTQALENLAIRYESVIALQAEMKGQA